MDRQEILDAAKIAGYTTWDSPPESVDPNLAEVWVRAKEFDETPAIWVRTRLEHIRVGNIFVKIPLDGEVGGRRLRTATRNPTIHGNSMCTLTDQDTDQLLEIAKDGVHPFGIPNLVSRINLKPDGSQTPEDEKLCLKKALQPGEFYYEYDYLQHSIRAELKRF